VVAIRMFFSHKKLEGRYTIMARNAI